MIKFTLKNALVDPDSRQPYFIFVCLAKSSTGDSILSTVRKAAKLAVYELIMIKVKNHHIAAIIRVETDLNCFDLNFCLILPNSLLWFKIAALLHEGPHCKPQGVAETELIDQNLLLITGVRIIPLKWTEPANTCFKNC